MYSCVCVRVRVQRVSFSKEAQLWEVSCLQDDGLGAAQWVTHRARVLIAAGIRFTRVSLHHASVRLADARATASSESVFNDIK